MEVFKVLPFRHEVRTSTVQIGPWKLCTEQHSSQVHAAIAQYKENFACKASVCQSPLLLLVWCSLRPKGAPPFLTMISYLRTGQFGQDIRDRPAIPYTSGWATGAASFRRAPQTPATAPLWALCREKKASRRYPGLQSYHLQPAAMMTHAHAMI